MPDEKKDDIRNAMYNILGLLFADTAESKRILGMLRHSAAKEIGEDPELFGWLIEKLPESLKGKYGSVSRAEQAIYMALTLVPQGPARGKTSFAEATKKANVSRNRLVLIETSDDINAMRQPLRGLFSLLKSKGMPVDYAELAVDLYSWQADKIKTIRKWEREYAKEVKTDEQ